MNLSDSNSKTPQTHRSACDNPTYCARWEFVANFIISLPFIAQHVIDKKLVLSLTRLAFPLVRFRLYQLSHYCYVMSTNAILFNTDGIWCPLSTAIRPCFQLFKPVEVIVVVPNRARPYNRADKSLFMTGKYLV